MSRAQVLRPFSLVKRAYSLSLVRPHLVVLDVGLKVPNVLGPGLIAAVIVKFVLSKLLLFLGGYNGFSFRPVLPYIKKTNRSWRAFVSLVRLEESLASPGLRLGAGSGFDAALACVSTQYTSLT